MKNIHTLHKGIQQNEPATFLTEEFLLQSDLAARLYNDYVKDLPIIDYHNHLPPKEIAGDKKFENMTAIWLKGDHYKWRAMRAFGINEKFITGNASDEEKFLQWATMCPSTIKNPLFHWTQMELLKPFQITTYLNKKTAPGIYATCNDMLQQPGFSTRCLLEYFKVELVGTTDDPCDDLKWHQQIKNDGFSVKVVPSFRPDAILNIRNQDGFISYIRRLEEAAGIKITDILSLLEALQNRVDFFHANGCCAADHGLSQLPSVFILKGACIREFEDFINKKAKEPFSEPEAYAGLILQALCKMYHAKGWVQQFHLGAIRNNNKRMLATVGPDTGFDSMGDYTHAERISDFLSELDKTEQLAKTVLYNLNPADSEMLATMGANFNDGVIPGKIQYGAAWWFLDQKDGMEKQINTLANMGLISTFIGMTTDSRSFLSYSRHEYFRRIICNLFAEEMLKGELPNDENWMGSILSNICYYNACNYFNQDSSTAMIQHLNFDSLP